LHQIGSTKTLTIKNGDVFELWCGDLAESKPRVFRLKQNNQTVHTVEDLDEVSKLGAGYRNPGIGGYADNYAVFYQNPPPALAGWTWAAQA
jgi:hypothetical protein